MDVAGMGVALGVALVLVYMKHEDMEATLSEPLHVLEKDRAEVLR